MVLGLKKAFLAPLALYSGLALGCAGKPGQPAQKFPVLFKGERVEVVSPAFQGSLPKAALFMKQKSLRTMKEAYFLYLPAEKLLFDIGLAEYPGMVVPDPGLKKAIIGFYRQQPQTFHTHIDWYDKRILDSILATAERDIDALKDDVEQCKMQSPLLSLMTEKCMPFNMSGAVFGKSYLEAMVAGFRSEPPLWLSEKVWLSYIPSDRDFVMSGREAGFGMRGRSGIVIADAEKETLVVSYWAESNAGLKGYKLSVDKHLADVPGFTRRRLDNFVAESVKNGVHIEIKKLE